MKKNAKADRAGNAQASTDARQCWERTTWSDSWALRKSYLQEYAETKAKGRNQNLNLRWFKDQKI